MTASREKTKIGVDEAGRGAIAGPLVVCAVYHPDPGKLLRMGARDSKTTDRDTRRSFFKKFQRDSRGVCAVAVADSDWINQAGVNTAEAQKVMASVTEISSMLEIPLEQIMLLGDGDKNYPNLPEVLENIFRPKADSIEPLIMAASMIAKFVHDDLADAIAAKYPGWGFESHRGYSSPFHVEMLYNQGLLPVHRTRAASKSVLNSVMKRSLKQPEWLQKARPQPHV
jgi:ribonuclease HII